MKINYLKLKKSTKIKINYKLSKSSEKINYIMKPK